MIVLNILLSFSWKYLWDTSVAAVSKYIWSERLKYLVIGWFILQPLSLIFYVHTAFNVLILLLLILKEPEVNGCVHAA